MIPRLLARVARVAAPLAAAITLGSCAAREPEGRWVGEARYRGATLGVEIDLRWENDRLAGRFSSDEAMLLDLPLRRVRYRSNRLRFEIPDEQAPLVFGGRLEKGRITGVIDTGPVPEGEPRMSLTLERERQPAEPRPYRIERVTLPRGGFTLAGLLYAPEGARGAPAVLLLQGSSTPLADSYRAFADRFARAGIAALVFDRRGSGASGGDGRNCTYADLADDAAAWMRFLAAHPAIDSTRLGLWGLSQGGLLAPLVRARAPLVRAIVAVGAPGIPIGDVAAYQDSLALRRLGAPLEPAARAASAHRALTRWIGTRSGGERLAAELAQFTASDWGQRTSLPHAPPDSTRLRSWYWGERARDPVEWWRSVHVPVLLLWGEEDELVPAAVSAHAISQALASAGDRDVTVRTFPKANHTVRMVHLPGEATEVWDWPKPAPGYPDTVTAWLGRRLSGVRPATR